MHSAKILNSSRPEAVGPEQSVPGTQSPSSRLFSEENAGVGGCDGQPSKQLQRKISPGLLALVSAAFFMQLLDSTIVNAVVPLMAASLDAAPLQMRAALTCYVLALAVFTSISPWLCDRFGTRRVFAGAIVVFTLGSALCGLSQSIGQLVVARIVQGLGGAALLPVGRYVVARTADKGELVSAMSTIMTVGILGSIIGPLLGGLMAEMATWRLVFIVNLPIGLAGLWLTAKVMPDYRQVDAKPLDSLGFVLFATACAALLAASELSDAPGLEGSGKLLWLGGCLVLASLCAVAYVRHSRRVPNPVVALDLLQLTNVRVSLMGNVFTRLGVSGFLLAVVLWLQLGLGWSPLWAGFAMMPQALGSIVGKRFIDSLLARFGYRRFLLVNTLLVAAMIAAFALPGQGASVALVFGMMFLYGLLMGMQFVAMTTLVFVDLDSRHTAMVSSMAATAQYLSMSFGIALASLLMSFWLPDQSSDGYVFAFRFSMVALAALTALASVVFLRLDRTCRPR